jgi:hypothetical protein
VEAKAQLNELYLLIEKVRNNKKPEFITDRISSVRADTVTQVQ